MTIKYMLFSTYIKRRSVIFDKHIENLENKINANRLVNELGIQVPCIYHVLETADDLNNVKLPNNCVIKFNNLACSNGIVIRKNSNYINYNSLEKVIDYLKQFENQPPRGQISIHNIKQLIMVEELLEPCSGDVLYDIKCFCFYGKVKYIQVINPIDRNECCMYNREGTLEYIYKKDAYSKSNFVKKPKYFNDVIKEATKVASHFTKDYALRIDFYSTTKGVVFGEFTFNPNAGNGLTKIGDKLMGSYLKE